MIKFIRFNTDNPLPERSSGLAAGMDLRAAESATIQPGEYEIIRTGFAWCASNQNSVYGRVASRSGLAAKHGIEVGAGVIDLDYQGEIKVILHNHGKEDFTISKGDRIAQLIIEQCLLLDAVEVQYHELATNRGAGGFGSTGVK